MDRLQLSFFGPTNSGKSALVNALAGQEVSLVSPVPGTTTDAVRKLIELPELGACVLVDTAGYDDDGTLGDERERLTLAQVDGTDIAVVMLLKEESPQEKQWLSRLGRAGVPVIGYIAKSDLLLPQEMETIAARHPDIPLAHDLGSLLDELVRVLPEREERHLTGSLVKAGDCVLLVMPQDSEAPKGRIILPQVQVLRELLDRGCNALCCTPASLSGALERVRPDLVITDSQVFATVAAAIPADTPLTSFSVLLAAAKGDIRFFVEGAAAIDALKSGDRVLIAEACTHVPDTEDIGRVKIPTLLRKKVGEALRVEIAAGNDFPEDLSPYALIIHCGACVATASLVRSRIRKAHLAGVPMTNYGIALAKLQGILERIALP